MMVERRIESVVLEDEKKAVAADAGKKLDASDGHWPQLDGVAPWKTQQDDGGDDDDEPEVRIDEHDVVAVAVVLAVVP